MNIAIIGHFYFGWWNFRESYYYYYCIKFQ